MRGFLTVEKNRQNIKIGAGLGEKILVLREYIATIN
jgi:hypothetical protein